MQLRGRIVAAIHEGLLTSDMKLPSTRKLAAELGVSRNTVTLVYQELLASGHLISRERSGIIVAPQRQVTRRELTKGLGEPVHPAEQSSIMRKAAFRSAEQSRYRLPQEWRQIPFPFVEGYYDRTLFPTSEWREASRMALATSEVETWSTDTGDADDPLLIEQLRQKILPKRGIVASADEILVTVGEQQALFLAFELLSKTGTRVALEDPLEPDIRALVRATGADIVSFPVDDGGVRVDNSLDDIDLIYTSPSRQRPTGVCLTPERRRHLMEEANANDVLVIEDDFESDLSFLADIPPALKSNDPEGRVVYVASLAKVLSPGLRLGYLVGPSDFIRAARQLRRLVTRKPSPITQRTAGIFLSLGHYDTLLRRLSKEFEQRLIALRDALNHYRPLAIEIPPVTGGTSYWVRGPDSLDGMALYAQALARGVLIEPATPYFENPAGRTNMFRLGVTSLADTQIRPGIAVLSEVMQSLAEAENTAGSVGQILNQAQLRETLAGVRLNYRTVYGDPCIIDLHPDGAMSGIAGYAQDDRDTGRWWIEGEYWCRQWNQWAYGETRRFRVALEGEQIVWINEHDAPVDSAMLIRHTAG